MTETVIFAFAGSGDGTKAFKKRSILSPSNLWESALFKTLRSKVSAPQFISLKPMVRSIEAQKQCYGCSVTAPGSGVGSVFGVMAGFLVLPPRLDPGIDSLPATAEPLSLLPKRFGEKGRMRFAGLPFTRRGPGFFACLDWFISSHFAPSGARSTD